MAERDGSSNRRFKRLFPLLAVPLVMAGVLANPGPANAGTPIGYACAYYTNVSLGGGPYGRMGCPPQNSIYAGPGSLAPAVTLPAGGSSTTISASDPDGAMAKYGPAVIFGGPFPTDPNAPDPPSGSLSVSTGGISSVTSTAIANNVGPQQFTASQITARCTATATSKSRVTTISNGQVVTSTTADGDTATSVAVPSVPPVNYTVHGTINSVGDSFRIVFNEHLTNANGSVTVNGAHMYLQGPFALGDMIIAQATCGA